ncbi:hypothetical protein M2480_000574 [Parabacteroides sp. PFB2-12]|uniref:hypothetical protein n=1 Tax=unclassified Parabacteroides TaxID=2649774 RepID=UPI002474C2E6|nr:MULTISPECIES: hypothetical protein [unclassified Parabacteroides]MDH6341911.1 hypothetical protein [Parabacteroides sp. PM6-13]MDH6389609.1 hypothetical protein [Parabacteroides sp. PFB2-12]
MKSKVIQIGLIVLAVVCVAYIIYSNITLNFTVLAFLFLLGAFLITREDSSTQPDPYLRDLGKSNTGILILSFAVLLTCYTLSNYFFARNEIYSNSDHHAVRIDGVNIHNPKGFVVAGDHEHAFFDNSHFQGTMRIREFDDQHVRLRLDGFTQALYLDRYGEESILVSSELLNRESLIPVQATDKLQFIGNRDTCEIAWNYHFVKKWRGSDTAECHYSYTNKGVTHRVAENRIIKKGLDLNTILGEVVSNIDFKGVNLLRDRHSSKLKPKDYAQESFVIELNREAFEQPSIREIRVLSLDGTVRTYAINALKRTSEEVVIPIGQAFTIGCLGGLKSLPVRLMNHNGLLSLEYVTPQYHYLSSQHKEGANTVFITTSLSREIIENQNPPENIMLFDFFNSEENGNNFQSPIYLSYVAGPTTQEMSFLINRETNLIAGEQIPAVMSQNGRLMWQIEVEDFKATAPYINENNILLFIIILGACCILNIVFGRSLGHRKPHTAIEQIAYLALILFFSFRLLLMWRAAVFPPVELASIYEFLHFFRSEAGIRYQFIGLTIFFAAIQSIKLIQIPATGSRGFKIFADFLYLFFPTLLLVGAEIFLFDLSAYGLFALPFGIYLLLKGCFFFFRRFLDKPKWFNRKWAKLMKNKWWPVWLFLRFLVTGLILLAVFKLIPLGGAVVSLLLPICLYFLFEFFFWRYWPGASEGIYKEIKRTKRLTLSQLFSTGLGLSLLNGLMFSCVFFFLDGGFGLIFISFFLLVSLLKLFDFVNSFYDYTDRKYIRIAYSVIIIGLPILFIVFLFYEKDILAWLATASPSLCIIAIGVALVAVAGLIGALVLRIKPNLKSLSITIVAALVLSSIFTFAYKEVVLTKHTAQRMLVHILTPEEGLKNTKTAEDERRFFEASINDYILNVYNRQANEVGVVGGKADTYFKMQKHSRVGAMFGAQTSDILMARFVIAEHGKYLPILFLFLYLFMLYLGVKMKTTYRASKMLLVQIPALLFIHSLFVWLANTQMFIFVGQDFPLFSLHSKFALLYYFVLTTLWVCVATIEKAGEIQTMKDNNTDAPRYYHRTYGRVFSIVFGFMLLLFVGRYAPEKNESFADKRYTLTDLLEETKDKISRLNVEFAKFQDSTRIATPNLSDVSYVTSAFHYQQEGFIKSTLGSDSTFFYRIWERFALKGGAKSNKSSSLIHARRKNDVLFFDVRTNYFNRNLPTIEVDSWRGSIVAGKPQIHTDRMMTENNSFRQFVLPRSWVRSTDDVVLLKHLRQRNTTIGNDRENYGDFTLESGYASACRRFPYDRFNSEGLESVAADTYFARNVVINGSRSFVYPMAERFFWSYTFANEVAWQKNRQTVKTASFHDDIGITIDRELTSDIYQTIGNAFDSRNLHAPYMSVVVADGDGQIRAMVDRKTEYVLNPNNRKELQKVEDDLYMDSDSEKNDGYFGNMNLFAMPDGPGSSQKPIVWTAVASGVDYDWKNLQILRFSDQNGNIGLDLSSEGKYYTRFFNGERLYTDRRESRLTFDALRSDENNGAGVGLRDYIRKSSNYYNALMLYIGSFHSFQMNTATESRPDPAAMFVEVNRRELFTPQGRVIRSAYDLAFPVLTRSQENYNRLFKLNRTMPRDYENSLLFTRLYTMFGFNSGEKISSLYEGLNLSTHPTKRTNTYAFVVNPMYTYNLLSNSDREFLLNAIHYAAVGGGVPWQVSPLSMAQIFGQLTMLKKNYRLTLEPIREEKKEHESYTDLSAGYLEARSEFLAGMNGVFSSVGTAGSIGATRESTAMKKGGYYLYGKTGTSNEIGTTNSNLHRLGVVITNQPIEALSVEQLERVKFYTVYFTARYNRYVPFYGIILDQIIASDSFREYMSGDQEQD